jgi:hypothetical protein
LLETLANKNNPPKFEIWFWLKQNLISNGIFYDILEI